MRKLKFERPDEKEAKSKLRKMICSLLSSLRFKESRERNGQGKSDYESFSKKKRMRGKSMHRNKQERNKDDVE